MGAAVGIALIGVALAGCGGSSTQPAAATTTSAAPKAVAPSPNTIGLCGGVEDAEVGQRTGLSDLQRVSVNPMSCVWQSPSSTGHTVVFHWFRGSSLEERRSQVTSGKPNTLQVGGRSGIYWQGSQTCEVAVAFGDTDFIDWSVQGGIPWDAAKEPTCLPLILLAGDTLKQAGQG
ncbi:hypothetical protein GCM10027167_08370 [Nocardia heshunensis]